MERDFDNTASQEKEEDDFNPVKELRCALVKTSLKSFVVEHAARYYQAAAFRVMLPSPPEVEVWLARQRMEERLAQESMVVGFFSCATALQNVSKDKKTNQNIAGISFWVMFDAPEMVIESFENHLTRIARDIGLETVHSKAVKGRGIKSITGGYVSSLYITLKDYNNEALLHHFAKSQMKCVRKAAQEEDITLENVEMTEGERYSSKKLTSLWLLESMATDVASELKKSVKCLDGLMNIKLVDLTSENPVIAAPRPVSKLMQGITAIKSYMERFGYGLFDGHIYKRAPAAKFTYVYCSSVLDFVHFTLGSPNVADQIGSQVNPIINLLSVSSCRVIKPIKIDYNFIEVTPFGTCFNIREKCFQVDPVDLEGSPRAFVKYTYDEKRTPNPKPFVQGVENSFGNPVILRKFYKKYYQLLMHGQFPHKESKLCLVGPADSGKTSWFAPFQGVIPVRYIAGVMNDGRFSAALISNNTQICMMDEWTPDSLSCEDAKRVLQGGMNFLPQKHKSGLRVNYNSGFFITTNVYPDFGNERDNEAIKKRLEVFQTSSLKRRDPSVAAWLRMNCMEVFHYLANELRGEPIFDTPTQRWNGLQTAPGTGAIFNDFDFDPLQLMYNDEIERFSFSQSLKDSQQQNPTDNSGNGDTNDNANGEGSLVQALDHAVLQADKEVGVHYEDLVWETPLFDNYSENCDGLYIEKVLTLASNQDGEWEKLKLTDNAKNMFRRRLRSKWEGADSVYDAWLIRKGCQRSWFDYHDLYANHPEFDPNAEQEPPTQASKVITDSPIKSYQQPSVPETDDSDDDTVHDQLDEVDHQNPTSSTAKVTSCIKSNLAPPVSALDDAVTADEKEALQEPQETVTKVTTVPETPTKSSQPPTTETDHATREDEKPTKSSANTKSCAESSIESDASIQTDTLEDPPADHDDKPSGKRSFRLSLKRCTQSQSAIALSSDDDKTPKKLKTDSEGSIEFDISKDVDSDTKIIHVSSNSSSETD